MFPCFYFVLPGCSFERRFSTKQQCTRRLKKENAALKTFGDSEKKNAD